MREGRSDVSYTPGPAAFRDPPQPRQADGRVGAAPRGVLQQHRVHVDDRPGGQGRRSPDKSEHFCGVANGTLSGSEQRSRLGGSAIIHVATRICQAYPKGPAAEADGDVEATTGKPQDETQA
ncbi:hypothetical protein AAFF_G00181050 [Aldrovandia affinis]|uniref:Uncharacterized protein n=1 Tax=Aldrovandia affinis TaxID=143900 RepID=A0AAD7SYN7_9TELE|nr:hypothetical protein AAFF_G00181050 [Aldrovandia affinis]